MNSLDQFIQEMIEVGPPSELVSPVTLTSNKEEH